MDFFYKTVVTLDVDKNLLEVWSELTESMGSNSRF